MHTRHITKSKGFTLIELLIVIGIIGFLAAAVLVAVDPVKRIQDSRDSKRFSEVNGILNGILTKQVDDRALYSATRTGSTNNAPILSQTGTNVQVLVTSDAGIVCNAAATRPGCDKPMDIAAANKNCVANVSDTFTGTGTAATTASAVVTGTGTQFVTELRVGDTLTSASGGTGVIASITDLDTLTLTATPTPDFSGAFTVLRAGSLVPNYIASLPNDPATGAPCITGSTCATVGDLSIGTTNSGYYIARTAGNRVEIGACKPEQATTISVKR